MAVQIRLVTSESTATPSSTSLKCGSGAPAYSSRPPSRERTGGRWTLFSRPSARSEAGTVSLRPCWYWMPTASRPKSSAMRSAAMYILNCECNCASVSSVASSVPVRNSSPASSNQARTARASSSLTRLISATKADWESRSLYSPIGLRYSSSKMALYMPMQPSSNTPRMAFSVRSWAARPRPRRTSSDSGHSGLGQTAGQIQQPDQARELTGPVGHQQDRTLVRPQAGQHVVRVLPDGLDDDQRRIRRNVLEHLDPDSL